MSDPGTAPTQKLMYSRDNAHATFNGGHHDDCCRAAFHHGMDTVYNLLDAGQAVPAALPASLTAPPPSLTPPIDAIEGAGKLASSEARRWPDKTGEHWEQIAQKIAAYVLAYRVAAEVAVSSPAPPAVTPEHITHVRKLAQQARDNGWRTDYESLTAVLAATPGEGR